MCIFHFYCSVFLVFVLPSGVIKNDDDWQRGSSIAALVFIRVLVVQLPLKYYWYDGSVVLTGEHLFSQLYIPYSLLYCIGLYVFVKIAVNAMTTNPPPYAPGETKGLYPAVQGDPQLQQQPGVYYQPQGPPAVSGAPGVASVTYYPSGPQQQQPQQLIISQPAPVVVGPQQERPPSLVCHVVLSCFAFCFNWPCGCIAFILAGKTILLCFRHFEHILWCFRGSVF